MNKPWLGAGLIAVAGAIVFNAWWPNYSQARMPETQARMQEFQRRQDCQFSVTADMDRMLNEIKDNVGIQEAARWANCDSASTYPGKDTERCGAGTVVIGTSD